MKLELIRVDMGDMQTTPAIPAELRRSPSPAYASIYDYDPHETRLFGTESLYGGWDSPILLLAKHFAPTDYIEWRRAQQPCVRLFSHDPEWPMNINLEQIFVPLLPCKPLYGSVLAGLLRKDGERSGSLPDRALIEPFAIEVIRFTVNSMPNLRAIACLGVDSWEFTTLALYKQQLDWNEHRNARRCVKAKIESRDIALHALACPSRFTGGLEQCIGDWRAFADSLELRRAS